jgi:hypothetical protein
LPRGRGQHRGTEGPERRVGLAQGGLGQRQGGKAFEGTLALHRRAQDRDRVVVAAHAAEHTCQGHGHDAAQRLRLPQARKTSLGPFGSRQTTPEIDKENRVFGIAPHRLLEGGERLRPLAQRRPRRAHGMNRRRRQGRQPRQRHGLFQRLFRLTLADEIEDRPRLSGRPKRDLRALRLALQLAARAVPEHGMERLPDRGLLRFGLQRRAEHFFRLGQLALFGQHATDLEQHFRLARRGLENAAVDRQRAVRVARLLQAERLLVEPGYVRRRRKKHRVRPTG